MFNIAEKYMSIAELVFEITLITWAASAIACTSFYALQSIVEAIGGK